MSAEDIAFSSQDREVLQEMIKEGFAKVTPAMKSREKRLQLVEQTIPSSLLRSVPYTLTRTMSKLDQPFFTRLTRPTKLSALLDRLTAS